jgi:hypothetical protein
MPDQAWWAQAHGTPGALPKAPGDDSQIKLLNVLWTLTYRGHSCRAELWGITSSMAQPSAEWLYDLRYVVDGELRETRLYRGTAAAGVAAAMDKKAELLGKGWRDNG